jgi:hypothetical protein
MKFAFRAIAAFCLLVLASCEIPAFAQPLVPHPVTGQVVIAVTGTAVQLPYNNLYNGVVVKAISANNVACGTVGSVGVTNSVGGTGNGYILCPGEGSSFAVTNTNSIYVNGTAGDIFTYEGN